MLSPLEGKNDPTMQGFSGSTVKMINHGEAQIRSLREKENMNRWACKWKINKYERELPRTQRVVKKTPAPNTSHPPFHSPGFPIPIPQSSLALTGEGLSQIDPGGGALLSTVRGLVIRKAKTSYKIVTAPVALRQPRGLPDFFPQGIFQENRSSYWNKSTGGRGGS